MSEYRNELVAAHNRIVQLEDAVAEHKRGGSPGVSKAVVAAGALACGLAIGGAVVAALWPKAVSHREQSVLPVLPAVLAEHLVPAPWRVPTLVDVNADGTPDIVGVFSGASDGMIRVAALDGVTFAPRWMTAAFPPSLGDGRNKPWISYVVAGDRLVVADGGNLLVYGLADGKFQVALGPDSSAEVCLARTAGIQSGKKAADGSFFVGEIAASPTEVLVPHTTPGATKIVDVATGVSRDPGNEAWCFAPEVGAPGAGCARKSDDECSRYAGQPFATEGFSAYMTFFEGVSRVSVGNDGSGEAIGFKAGQKSQAWRRSLAVDGDRFDGYMTHAIGDGRFFSVYGNPVRGAARVVARSVETGQELWHANLAPDADAYPVAMSVDKGRVLVLTRARSLNVLDAATGKLLHQQSEAHPRSD